MVCAERLLADGERALIESLGLRVFGLSLGHESQTGQGNGVVRVTGSEPRLQKRFQLVRLDERFREFACTVQRLESMQNCIGIALLRGRWRQAESSDHEGDGNKRRKTAHDPSRDGENGAWSIIARTSVRLNRGLRRRADLIVMLARNEPHARNRTPGRSCGIPEGEGRRSASVRRRAAAIPHPP